MKRYSVFACLMVVLMAAVAFAGGDRDFGAYNVADGAAQNVHYGAPISSAKQDTVYAFGGPAAGDQGKFEAAGSPSLAGWTSVDNTQKTVSKWNISTFHADMIGGMGPLNNAWWCGEYFTACSANDTMLGGYGNGYLERLNWVGSVSNPSLSTNVKINFDIAWDSEPGFDYTRLKYADATGFVTLAALDGADTVLGAEYTFTMTDADYQNGDEVQIRFEFQADGGWSDSDCLWPTSGACQIDNIAVYFDDVLQGTVEDCEGKAPAQWFTSLPPGVGDFAKAWPALDDIDPCRSNGTPVLAFIDDGVVVPGTGGYLCQTWCYGPNGFVVNPEGGLAGPEFHLDNYVFSPLVSWPAGPYDGATLRFDVYRHFHPSFAGYNGLFYTWSVRSTLDATGLTGWTGWRDDNFVYYGGADWVRNGFGISQHLEPGRLMVQFTTGAYELGWAWNWTGTDSAPAPYFDNVCFVAYTFGGPSIAMREIDALNDNFPAIGIIDYSNLGNNDIRVDMALNIAPADDAWNDPGDSMVATIKAVRTGGVLHGAPRMYYKFKTNPLFDPYRDGAFTDAGYVFGYQVYTATGTPVADKFWFELPDEDWFYPGDVFHYYLWAQDDVTGDIGTSLLPADTTGFSDFSGPMAYNTSFEIHGLPTIWYDSDLAEYKTPPTLFWNDFANRGAENEWYLSLANLGFELGVDYDIYYTNGPSSGVGNGLGGRATSPQLDGYDNILYEAGNLNAFTITNVDYDSDAGDDVGVLDGWLRLKDKNLAIFGDDVIFDMTGMPQSNTFISNWMGISFVDRDLNPLIGNQATPTVQIDAGNGVFSATTEWIAYGGCLGFNTFDAVNVTTGTRLAHFLDPLGGDTYTYSAATLNYDATDNVNVIHVPYGFHYIYTPNKAPTPSATRTQMLEEILLFFGASGTGTVSGAITKPMVLNADAYPNPFNPQVTIKWNLSEAGKVTVKVYNVRGELVKTLAQDELVPTNELLWKGDDNSGRQAPSGVYFAKVTKNGQTVTKKMALVK